MLFRLSSTVTAKKCLLVGAFAAAACGGSDGSSLFGPNGTSAGSGGEAASGNGGSAPIGGAASGASAGGSTAGSPADGEAGASPADGGTSGSNGGSDPGGSTGEGGSTLAGAGGTSGAPSSGGSAPTGGGGSAGGSAGAAGTAGSGGAGPGCVAALEICDGLDNDCDAQVDEGRACTNGCAGFVIEGRGYMYCSMANTLNAARLACEQEDMRLVWIETAEENAALVRALAELVDSNMGPTGPDPGVRIGASDADEEGEWAWIDGDMFWEGNQNGEAVDGAFVAWSRGRPNNGGGSLGGENCAVILVEEDGPDGEPGEWNDVRCTQVQPFVCETP